MRIILVISFLLLSTSVIFAQTPGEIDQSPAVNNMFLAADYACFKYSDNIEVCFVEVYYSLNRSQLSFQPDSVGYFALMDMNVEIKTEMGDTIDANSWRVANRISNLAEAEISNYLINDIIKARLEPGEYTITIKASDVYSGKTGMVQLPLAIPSFSDTDLNLSQIELVYQITDADGGNFDKAGMNMIPNTRSIYSHDDEIVYLYAEVYNLDQALINYTCDTRVYDANGNLYKELPPQTSDITGDSGIILKGFNIVAFKLGSYKIVMTVYAGGNSVSEEKYFEVTPGRREWELAREKQELSDFPEADEITTEEEAKNFRNQVLYIATRDELKQYDALPIHAKTNFATAFWARRDPTPQTGINEFKLEHYERFRYVNEEYSSFRSSGSTGNGWRSDRGRVHIVYGPPSDEENFPSSLEELPWVRWNYDDVEGGVYFIFVDESGYGNYRMIHSTARSEPKDYNWETRIRPSAANIR
ncbi:MAG: GWxTD domain-containing protein [candidate division Zixibacteria bacterium]|nr:GWxTD domain-containing protein [candidate division Zixibacteria bacterium]